MDAKQTALQEKLRKLLKEAAEVGAQIQAIEQGPGTPHYDQIESHAHEVGQQLSQLMQQTRMVDVTAEHAMQANCECCGKNCRVGTRTREIISQDGPTKLTENVAHCTRCRRDFFPST